MNKITPFLWFDSNAEEAVKFYTSVFAGSKIDKNITRYNEESAKASGQQKNSVMTVAFQLMKQDFVAINGGPAFKFNPSISFFVMLENKNEVNKIWEKLIDGGNILMELQEYPWSEWYGWVQDKFGLSWQLSIKLSADYKQTIIPSLLFVGKQHGKAEEAVRYYTSIFNDSSISTMLHYERGESEPEGTVKFAQFNLSGLTMSAMDSSLDHRFTFNEAVSFVVNCQSQKELDYFWDKLSKGGDEKAQMCGWLKDKFGLSWQIVPEVLNKLLQDKDTEKSRRVMQAVLKMKKLNIDELMKAFEGHLVQV